MTNAVSYAYITPSETRPSLLDQFKACHTYANTHGYKIVGEFNDIDEEDHKATGAGLEASGNAISQYGAAVIFLFTSPPPRCSIG